MISTGYSDMPKVEHDSMETRFMFTVAVQAVIQLR